MQDIEVYERGFLRPDNKEDGSAYTFYIENFFSNVYGELTLYNEHKERFSISDSDVDRFMEILNNFKEEYERCKEEYEKSLDEQETDVHKRKLAAQVF